MGWLLLLFVAHFRFIFLISTASPSFPICSQCEAPPCFFQIKIEFMLSVLFIIFLPDFSYFSTARVVLLCASHLACFDHLLFWGLRLQHVYIQPTSNGYIIHVQHWSWFNKMNPTKCNCCCYATYILNYNDSAISFDILYFLGSTVRSVGRPAFSIQMRCDCDTEHLCMNLWIAGCNTFISSCGMKYSRLGGSENLWPLFLTHRKISISIFSLPSFLLVLVVCLIFVVSAWSSTSRRTNCQNVLLQLCACKRFFFECLCTIMQHALKRASLKELEWKEENYS